ncbi:phosphatidylinositol 3-kinase catalytic subunit type 3 [Camelus ferus]|nr:phosphatidylinositol 3-kinase catalytic subunit type 3 [Camelus ferus]
MGEAEKFHYIYSCDLDINVQLKIGSLEGKREQKSYKAVLEDPMLRFSGLYQETCSDLYVTCQVFAEGKPLALPVRTSYKAFSTRWNWNEWLKLPVKYPDLPRNAQVALTIWDVYGPGKAVPVGGTTVSLFGKYGMFRQGMHDLKVWPNVEADGSEPTKTPGRTSSTVSEDQMSRLAKLTKAHRQGHMVKVDWLDRLTFREIEMINESEKRSSNFMYLMVEFRCVKCDDKEYGIVYYEKIIVSYPPTKQLTYEEQDLVWKFRYYLTNQEKALTKFLKCVNWDLPQEAKQALELLGKWKPMDVEDSLELLSSHYTNPTVRRYAVARLRQADDEDLLMYLLQLVQALKYENFDDIKNGLEPTKKDAQGSVSEGVSNSGINPAEVESSQIITSPLPPVSSPPPASKTKESSDGENLEHTSEEIIGFQIFIESGDKSVRVMRSLLAAQQTFVDRLVHLMKAVQRESGNRKKKNERLQALLGDNEKMNLSDVELIPLPLEPQVKIRGIIPETATLFKLLRKENLDLKLTPYKVLATSTKHGKLFHIDFGYILGRDPKPLPPPMKLNKEMVEGMGGTQSEQYQEFRKQCYTAFLHLRRYSNLILNLFSLMVDANIPDIALEPDKTVKKVQDKFRLDLSDEEAVHYMQSLIDESVHALFAAVVEQIHKFAQGTEPRLMPKSFDPYIQPVIN